MEGFSLPPYVMLTVQTTLYLNGINLVPGTVALANDSDQNSAALKNITINTGSAKFNTAIEYDTDVNNTAYSRIKHYIVGGKAYSYTYDEVGNISKITNPDGSWVEYEYDSLNQLKKEIYSAALPFASLVEGGGTANAVTEGVSYDTIQYTYDTRGNILQKTYSLDNTVVDTITYGYTDSKWKDRLTSYNGVTITADEIGNPLSWHDGSAMTWRRGRQLASHTKNGVTSTYAYDDEGVRTSKTVNGVTTKYSVADGTLRRMSDGTNTLQFVYGNGLSSVIFNGTEYWYVFNAQGDVIGLIDAAGSYVVEYTYDSWGKPLSKTGSLADTLGTINPFRYRGYIYDEESGFYYVTSRYYDSEVGRWLNADGQLNLQEGVTGYNIFLYCGNNPVNRADPTGEAWWAVAILVGCAVLGAFWGFQAPYSLAPPEPEPKYPTVEQKQVDFNDMNDTFNYVDEHLDQNNADSFINYKNDTPIKPQPEMPAQTNSPQISMFNSDNILDIAVDENGLTVGDKVVNTMVGAGAGLMVGGSLCILGGVYMASLGTMSAVCISKQAVALGALAYNIPSMVFAPLYGVEIEMIELFDS